MTIGRSGLVAVALAAAVPAAAAEAGDAAVRFPWMTDLSLLLNAFSTLFWPVLAVIVIAALRKPLATVLTSLGERGGTVKIGGAEVSVGEVAKQNSDNVGDLLTQVAQLQEKFLALEKAAGGGHEEGVYRPPADTPSDSPSLAGLRLLWVDDRPQNNAMIADNFTKLGMIVQTALSTDEAIRCFDSGHFDAVISDMGRADDDQAGITLTTALRKRSADLPIFIYCGPGGVRHLGAAACAAGATEVTDSQTVLTRHVMRLKRLSPP